MEEVPEKAGQDRSGAPHPSATFGEGALEYGVAGEVSLRWAAVHLTAVVEEARRRHDLSPIAAVALGRLGGLKGGKARAEKLSPKKRSEIAKKAAESRWKKYGK